MNRELYITSIAAIALLVYGCNSMALKSEDPKERMAAVQQIDDQDDLLDIALNEEYSDDVRLAATAKMEKPHALWRVWCFSTNKADIAAKALSRISDNDYLARIAMLAPYEESKEEIEAREKKEKILTGLGVAANIGGSLLAEKTGHAEVASAGAAAGALAAAAAAPESLVLASYADFQTNQAVLAVEKITAGEKLGEIAANSVSRPVQLAALRRYMPFADANKRAEVAMSGALYKAKIRSYSAKDARKNVATAVREINDPSLLKRIAANSSTIMIGRRMAFARLVQMKQYDDAGRVMWWCAVGDRDIQAVLPNVTNIATIVAILCDERATSVANTDSVASRGKEGNQIVSKGEELLQAAAKKIEEEVPLKYLAMNCRLESVQADALRRYMRFAPTNIIVGVVKTGCLPDAKIQRYCDANVSLNIDAAVGEIKEVSLLESLAHESGRDWESSAGKSYILHRLIALEDFDAAGRALWDCTAGEEDLVSILPRVESVDTLVSILSDARLVSIIPEKARAKIKVMGGTHDDLPNEKAKEIIGLLPDGPVFPKLVASASLFSVRCAAAERTSGDEELAKLFLDKLEDCPYDTSLEGYDSLAASFASAVGVSGKGFGAWIIKTQAKSQDRLRKLIVSRISNVDTLKRTRKAAVTVMAKKQITERLAELGASDVDEIVSAELYDDSLMCTLEYLKNTEELAIVAEKAKLKGVRLMAAGKISEAKLGEIAKTESPDAGECPKGKLDICGVHLGIGIEDVFAKVAAIAQEIRPTLYLDDDGKVICLKGANGRDIAWAKNTETLPVYWLTLPPQVVKGMFNFETGTLDDLERAICHKLGISFGSTEVKKGAVEQEIGNLETAAGETLRFFRAGIKEGKSHNREVRKAVYNAVDPDGLGAVLANAAEDAAQEAENAENRRSPRFAEKGSLQLQNTEDAAKSSWEAKGSWTPTQPSQSYVASASQKDASTTGEDAESTAGGERTAGGKDADADNASNAVDKDKDQAARDAVALVGSKVSPELKESAKEAAGKLAEAAVSEAKDIVMSNPATASMITKLVDMFKEVVYLYWLITIYSILIGAAMTFVGRRYFKTLLFLVGAFSVYVPVHYFASETVSLVSAAAGGLIMVFCYPIFVFIIGMLPVAIICVACGMEHPNLAVSLVAFGCGIAAIIFRKHIVIPVSAFSGSWMLALGIAFLMKGMHPILFLSLIVLFLAAGIFVQYKFTAKSVPVPKREAEAAPAPEEKGAAGNE